jgi:hypothetical protein
MTDLQAVHRAVRIARRRMTTQTWLTATGWSLLIALLAAMAIVTATRMIGIETPWPVYAGMGAVALLVPTMLALSRRPDPGHVAVLIDDRLRLKDRLSTALYVTTLPDDPLAPQVLRDAQGAAASAKVRNGFPVRLTRVWGWLPAAAAVFALLMVFVKPMDLLGLQATRLAQQQEAEQAAEAQERIVQAAAVIEQVQQQDAALDEIDPLSVMKEAASLTQRELSNPEYRQKAAAKLSAVEEKLAKAEEQKSREFEALQNALSRLDPQRAGPADRFAEALRRGDFEAAREALQALADSFDELQPQQQDAAREQIENLARQLDEAAKQSEQERERSQESIRRQLADAGLSQEQIDDAQRQGYDPEHLQQMLERQGMSQQQAQQMAQQTQQQHQQSQSQKECQGQCNGLGQSLQQMANAMRESQQGQGQSPPQGQDNQQGQPSPGGGMQSGSWQAQQQINDMARMQQQLQQMRQSQQAARQAMQSLQGSGGSGQQQQQNQGGGQPSQQGGPGGREAGTADGGNPYGAERSYQPQQVDAYGNIGEGEGRIIASWMQKGEAAAGDATVQFNTAVTQAREGAERAIADDRVPARYHEAVGSYFRQLPQNVDEVRRAPAAPR